MWEIDEKDIYFKLRNITESNVEKFEHEYSEYFFYAKEFLNQQVRVASFISWTLGWQEYSGHDETEKVVFSAFIKNLLLFFTIIELTNKGLYGPARTLMRSAFESLLIAKYCYLSHDMSNFRKWENGEHLNITNNIINKIKYPDSSKFRNFIKALNPMCHATVYAQQVSIEFDDIKEELRSNYSLIYILLDCNYHLMNRHWITNRILYYTQRYQKRHGDFEGARKACRETAKLIRRQMSERSKRLTLDYSSSWILN